MKMRGRKVGEARHEQEEGRRVKRRKEEGIL